MGKVLGMSQNYGSCWTEARLGVHLEANQFAGCWFWDMSQSAHFAVWVAFFSLDSTCSIFIERKIVKKRSRCKAGPKKMCNVPLFSANWSHPHFSILWSRTRFWKTMEKPWTPHSAAWGISEVQGGLTEGGTFLLHMESMSVPITFRDVRPSLERGRKGAEGNNGAISVWRNVSSHRI